QDNWTGYYHCFKDYEDDGVAGVDRMSGLGTLARLPRYLTQGADSSPRTKAVAGDPVFGDGEFVTAETDVQFPGEGPLAYQFTRSYRSRVGFLGPLGHSWDHNFNKRLVGRNGGVPNYGDSSITYYDGALHMIVFKPASTDGGTV